MATIQGVQYSGIWNLSSQANAKAAGTWTGISTYGLYVWGSNDYGQLGLGDSGGYARRSSPTQLGSATNWTNIKGAGERTMGIKSNGTLWTWGYNAEGQLGLGNTTNYSSPKQVGALTDWLQVSGGYRHTIAVKTDGTLWTWGINNNGQLGIGNTSSRSSPVQVGALTDWYKVSGGIYSSYAIKTDGTLWSWGGNGLGQLGLGTSGTNYSSPKQVGALTDWAVIQGSASWCLAVKTNGTLWSWGLNNVGQLGTNNLTYYSSPIQVGALTTWSKIANGRYFAGAVKTDGTLWMWGQNNQGQLGLGNTVYAYSSPKQVGALTNWSNIACGDFFCLATKSNNQLWSWGANVRGQLGLGNTTSTSSPQQVGTLTSWLNITGGGYHSAATTVTTT